MRRLRQYSGYGHSLDWTKTVLDGTITHFIYGAHRLIAFNLTL